MLKDGLFKIVGFRDPRLNIRGVEFEDQETKIACEKWCFLLNLFR